MYYFEIEFLDSYDMATEKGLVAAESIGAAVTKLEKDYKDIVSVTIEPWEDLLCVDEILGYLETKK